MKAHKKINWSELESKIDYFFNHISFFRINAERDIQPEPDSNEYNDLNLSKNGEHASNLINYVLNNERTNEWLIQRDLLKALNKIIEPDATYSGITVQKTNDKKWEVYLYENDQRYALSKMGSGLKTIILVLLNLLILPQLPMFKCVTDENRSIFFAFEELENNLHPALQRRLFEYIDNYSKEHNNTYIFLTTHSHVAINMFADRNDTQILHVTKDNGISKIQKIDNFLSKSEVLNDLDVRASDLFQSNGIIWVEGPSDRIYIKHWMSICGGQDLREGIDFQFLYYGGRLLAQYTAEEKQEENDLISILTTNRHSAIVIDSDKTSRNAKINSTKKRIQAEFQRLNYFCWITKGKEIENYVPCQAINNAFGSNLPQCGQYELFPDYISKTQKSFTYKKVSFAKKVIEYINDEDDHFNLDLKEKISGLVKEVRKWQN